MYYRDGHKGKKGWYGPARVIDKSSNEYTLRQDKTIISANPRDIRKFRRTKNLFELEFDEFETIPNQLMRHEATNDKKSFLIKKNSDKSTGTEKFKKQKCEMWGELCMCMSILAPKLSSAKQTKLDSLNAILKSLLKESYLCHSCVDYWQNQLVYSILQCLGISDFGENVTSKLLMEASTSKRKAKYELEILTGDITDDILTGFKTTAKQYGFELKAEAELKNNLSPGDRTLQKDNKILIPVAKRAMLTSPTPLCPLDNPNDDNALENSYEESDEELTGLEDTPADYSTSTEGTEQSKSSSFFHTMSNPDGLPIIDETNDVLRERRELYRKKRLENRQKAVTGPQTVSSSVKTETSPEDGQISDESQIQEMITQPDDPFRQPQFPSEQLENVNSDADDSEGSSEASLSTDDRQTQSIYGDDDNQLSDVSEVGAKRQRKQTQHFGMPINSGTRGNFTAEHYNAILETFVVSNEDKITNFEMLMRSREKELEGWSEFHVVKEVHVDESRRKKNVPLLTRWVDNWNVDSHGSRKMKSRLVFKGCQEDPTCLHSYSPSTLLPNTVGD